MFPMGYEVTAFTVLLPFLPLTCPGPAVDYADEH
jgi:hypothetical protein